MADTLASTSSLILYDAALGGTPDVQGKLIYRASPHAAATQAFADGATTLDTMASTADAAGYFGNPKLMPALDRAAGFALSFTVQVVTEDHAGSDKNGDGVGDRAGFSVIALGADARGIELGFWLDTVWAQADGTAEPPAGTLFTRAEHAPFDTTRITTYTLMIKGEAYDLSSDGRSILGGPVRDYTAFEGPVNPYRTPNFSFLGDDSGSARANIRLAFVGLYSIRMS